jgi:2-polyprenyl-3-methyl-5-hydroxy-6-metoxy-1,4-benzoquinol methylase
MAEKYRACVVCGHREIRYWFRPRRSPGAVVQCINCEFVFVGEFADTSALIFEGPVLGNYPPEWQTTSELDILQCCWEWPLIEKMETEWQGKLANASHFLKIIEERHPRGRLLDIGAFCGFFLHAAKLRGWEVIGIEPLVGPSVYARGKLKVPVITCTLEENTFTPESVDVVTAFQVFEHLPDPGKILDIVFRILRPGGWVVLEVPNIDHWSLRLLGKHHRHFVQDHLNFFGPRTLSKLLEIHGFENVSVENSPRSLSVAALIEWLPRLVGLSASRSKLHLRKSGWLRNTIIRINSGDIIVAYARKPG